MAYRAESGVYAIEHRLSGMVYIGSSVNTKQRLSAHRCSLSQGKHPNPYLQHAFNKYGADAFAFVVVELCDKESRVAREQHYIDARRSSLRAHGYNICPSAARIEVSAETRQKMSTVRKGRKRSPAAVEKTRLSQIGRKRPPETVEKVRLSNIGKKRTTETIERLRIAHLHQQHPPEMMARLHAGNVGKKRSEEAKHRMRMAQLIRRQLEREESGQLKLV